MLHFKIILYVKNTTDIYVLQHVTGKSITQSWWTLVHHFKNMPQSAEKLGRSSYSTVSSGLNKYSGNIE